MIILYLILIALGAVAYRLGGASFSDFPNLPKWLVRSSTRDIGVPIAAILSMLVLSKWHWSLLICTIPMYGAMTTYWKILNPFFNKPKTDCFWFNYATHGLMIGLAFIPYGIFTDTLPMVICRAILMAILMTAWSEFWADVDIEEGGRGAIIEGTLWML